MKTNKKWTEEREKEREADLTMALAVQSLAVAVLWRQWCCFKWWRERPERERLLFFSSPLFSFFLFCCVSLLSIVSVSSSFFESPLPRLSSPLSASGSLLLSVSFL